MLAGVLAATMSTLDSTINAINSCLHSDFEMKRSKKLSGFVSMLMLLIVAIVATQSTGLLTVGLKVASWSAGFLLAVIFLALFKNYFFSPGWMILAYLLNLFCIYMSANFLNLSWHWFTYGLDNYMLTCFFIRTTKKIKINNFIFISFIFRTKVHS